MSRSLRLPSESARPHRALLSYRPRHPCRRGRAEEHPAWSPTVLPGRGRPERPSRSGRNLSRPRRRRLVAPDAVRRTSQALAIASAAAMPLPAPSRRQPHLPRARSLRRPWSSFAPRASRERLRRKAFVSAHGAGAPAKPGPLSANSVEPPSPTLGRAALFLALLRSLPLDRSRRLPQSRGSPRHPRRGRSRRRRPRSCPPTPIRQRAQDVMETRTRVRRPSYWTSATRPRERRRSSLPLTRRASIAARQGTPCRNPRVASS